VHRRSAPFLRFTGVLAATVVLAALRIARAQDTCPTDGGVTLPRNFGHFERAFPTDGSLGVPIDGFVRLRYVLRAPRRPFVTVSETVSGANVEGDAFVVDNEVHWRSRAPLRSNTEFRVRFADPGSGTGENLIRFTTGSGRSSNAPPVFEGILRDGNNGPRVQRIGSTDLCADPDAVEVTVTWHRALPNGWPVSDIEYVVYQTIGPGITAPVERARAVGTVTPSSCGGGSADEQCKTFRLSGANAEGTLCFNIQAIDAYGRNDGNAVEACIDPHAGNTFVGACDARPPMPRRGTRTWLGLLAVGALATGMALVVRGSRRRSG
jgi:hypothetical protein